MNAKERNAAAWAALNKAHAAVTAALNQCQHDTRGLDTAAANKVYAARYAALVDRYEEETAPLYRLEWYTDPDLSRTVKCTHHRAVVRDMHDKGLHRMKTNY